MSMRPRELRKYIADFRALWALAPLMKNYLYQISAAPGDLDDFTDQVKAKYGSSRSDDIGSLRRHTIEYLSLDPTKPTVAHPLPMTAAAKGFHHIDTARALCPQMLLPIFNEEPHATMLQSLNGNAPIKVTARNYPSFLYDQDIADVFDSENPENYQAEEGLLRGQFLVKCYNRIFLGNGYGEDKSRGRPPLSKVFMKDVTPVSIAYTATLARFALSSQAEWTHTDGKFDYEVFYQSILELLNDQEDEWTVETLKWWNKLIFAKRKKQTADSDDEDNINTEDLLSAARAARKKARLQHQTQDQ